MAVIAPGTGLGEAFLTWDGSRYRAHASEGGHADLAPSDAAQIGLLQYLPERQKDEHVSYERICSGVGIPNIYDYLRDSGFAQESPELAQRLGVGADRTRVILDAALHPTEPCQPCSGTLDMFIVILGAEAGNLALKVLATGGVYLGGGIPLHVLPALDEGGFQEALQRKGRFADEGGFQEALQRKGRFAELLAGVPVHVIVCRAAIIGAASLGLELAQQTADASSCTSP